MRGVWSVESGGKCPVCTEGKCSFCLGALGALKEGPVLWGGLLSLEGCGFLKQVDRLRGSGFQGQAAAAWTMAGRQGRAEDLRGRKRAGA